MASTGLRTRRGTSSGDWRWAGGTPRLTTGDRGARCGSCGSRFTPVWSRRRGRSSSNGPASVGNCFLYEGRGAEATAASP